VQHAEAEGLGVHSPAVVCCWSVLVGVHMKHMCAGMWCVLNAVLGVKDVHPAPAGWVDGRVRC
jgi:heme/copper-type cytochrome/quinol oxidase subunit 3